MKCLSINDFSELYIKYGPMVLRRCKYMLKDEQLAVDATQDVFVKIIENREKVRNVCASLFYVTATRICLNKIRTSKSHSVLDFDEVSSVIEDDFSFMQNEKIDAEIFLNQLFTNRDEKDKMIATLHYVDGATLEETAAQMGMSVAGIRKRLDNLKKYAKHFVL